MPKRQSIQQSEHKTKTPKIDEVDKENHSDAAALIESTFLLKCPPDFFEFYAFCKSLSSKAPLGM